MENDILKQKLVDNGLLYTPIVVPDILKDCLLILAHDKQGHNGFRRTYASLKNRYHWKGMKKSVYQHCTNCQVCTKHNIKTQQLKNEHFSSPPQPMEFIAMDLIGEFHPASSKGNRFTLTAVCMLTGFTFCIPLKSKLQGFIRLVSHVGSGDPVRVLRLYTTSTLDEVCSIYC